MHKSTESDAGDLDMRTIDRLAKTAVLAIITPLLIAMVAWFGGRQLDTIMNGMKELQQSSAQLSLQVARIETSSTRDSDTIRRLSIKAERTSQTLQEHDSRIMQLERRPNNGG